MVRLNKTIESRAQTQSLIPGIKFTCHGFITKWILAAEWYMFGNTYPELQTWNSTDGITYTKQGATTFSLDGGSAEITFYEYTPVTPHEFHDGDVLGVFIPNRLQTEYRVFFKDTGLLNYNSTGGSSTTFQVGTVFNTSGQGISTANGIPLLAVEVCESQQ